MRSIMNDRKNGWYLDYRDRTAVTKRDVYPIPAADDLIRFLKESDISPPCTSVMAFGTFILTLRGK